LLGIAAMLYGCRPLPTSLRLLVLCLMPLLGRADTLDDIRQRGTLIWGADAEGGGPFVYPRDDDPSQFQGFEYEIAELLAKRLGVKAEFAQGQWNKLPELLERGDIDIVLNGYEWKQQWLGRYSISLPYYVYELQALVRTDDTRFQTLDDLKSARVAVLGGAAGESYLQERFGGSVKLASYEGSTDAMRAVELGIDGVDAIVQDLSIVTFYEKRFPKLRRLDEPVAPGYYVALMRKDDEALTRAINAAILDAWQDGSLPAILVRYGMWNETQRRRGLVTDEHGTFRPDLPAAKPDYEQATISTGESRLIAIARHVPFLLYGAIVTIGLSITSMPLAIAVGLLIAIGRLYGPKLLQVPLGLYVEVVRGTPLVLQLFVIFFLLPEIGISLPALVAAVLGLAINYSAYESEIYRAGLQAIPRGQMEAALSLGMSRSLALRRIIVPQAVRLVIPPVMNDFIALFKDTAVCSVITVVELSKQYYMHAQSAGAVVELGIVTALLYLAMSYPLSMLVNRLERRMKQ
jgi:polar amino acid transport system substrate-binding protein